MSSETVPAKEVLQLSVVGADSDRGFLAPKDYGGFPFNRTFLRGFTNESALRNGFRDYGYLGPSDFANIEAIDVLKGPASALYGNGKPGGDLNTVIKKADGSSSREASLSVNSFGFTRFETNLSGRVGGPEAPAFRFDGAVQGGPSFRDHVGGMREFVAPSVNIKLSSDTRVSVDLEVFRRSSVWDPVLLPNAFLLSLPVRRYLGETYNREHTRGVSLRVSLTHTLGPGLLFRQAVYVHNGHNDHEAAVYDTDASNLIQPDGVTVNRVSERVDDRRRFRVSQTEMYADYSLFGTSHTAVAGVEIGQFKYRLGFALAPIAGINAVDPTYGAQPSAYEPVVSQRFGTSTRVLYLGNRIALTEKVRAYVGIRVERFRTFLDDELADSPSSERTHTVKSPRLGVTYEPTLSNRFFVSATHSARPQIGTRSASGKIFDEETDSQIEFGHQASLLDKKVLFTISAFQIRRANVLTTDPTSPNFQIATGERRSRGLEVDLSGAIAAFKVSLNLALTDARVSKDVSIPVGARLPGVSKIFMSGFVQYKLPPPYASWSVALGLLREGETETTLPSNGLRLPAYSTTALSGTYEQGPLYFRIALSNAFNTRAFTSYGFEIRPVTPRTLQIEAGVEF